MKPASYINWNETSFKRRTRVCFTFYFKICLKISHLQTDHVLLRVLGGPGRGLREVVTQAPSDWKTLFPEDFIKAFTIFSSYTSAFWHRVKRLFLSISPQSSEITVAYPVFATRPDRNVEKKKKEEKKMNKKNGFYILRVNGCGGVTNYQIFVLGNSRFLLQRGRWKDFLSLLYLHKYYVIVIMMLSRFYSLWHSRLL